MKMWIGNDVANVRYVFIYTWMNKALYYRTNPAWNLCQFRTFFASSGGAMVEIGNVPYTDSKFLRSDYRKNDNALAHWTNEHLAMLARRSGHPEVEHAPVIFWGWSRDGMQATSYAEAMPERTLGAIRYMSAQHESERDFAFAGVLKRIPFLLTFADDDYMAGMDNVNFLRKGRAHHAPWVCAVMRHSTHGMNQVSCRVSCARLRRRNNRFATARPCPATAFSAVSDPWKTVESLERPPPPPSSASLGLGVWMGRAQYPPSSARLPTHAVDLVPGGCSCDAQRHSRQRPRIAFSKPAPSSSRCSLGIIRAWAVGGGQTQ